MILVVLGTHELPFTRLLQEVDELAQKGIITEEVRVQSGHTPADDYPHLHATPFVSYEEMNELYDAARLIIAHGGTGSIITGVKKRKPVIAFARLAKYGEHNDDHQEEIIAQFKETGHILSSGNLQTDIAEANAGFVPAPYESGREQILKRLTDFIDNI